MSERGWQAASTDDRDHPTRSGTGLNPPDSPVPPRPDSKRPGLTDKRDRVNSTKEILP
jgi:hypothetical protein